MKITRWISASFGGKTTNGPKGAISFGRFISWYWFQTFSVLVPLVLVPDVLCPGSRRSRSWFCLSQTRLCSYLVQQDQSSTDDRGSDVDSHKLCRSKHKCGQMKANTDDLLTSVIFNKNYSLYFSFIQQKLKKWMSHDICSADEDGLRLQHRWMIIQPTNLFFIELKIRFLQSIRSH